MKHSLKKKDIAFCQGIMAETRINAAYHNFSETSEIVLHKSKSRSGNFYGRAIYDNLVTL